MAKYAPTFNIYRGNKSKSGAASRFSLSKGKDGKRFLFLEMAKQVGENANGKAIFSWKGSKQSVPNSSVTVRLDEVDIGEFLTVISGRKNHAGSDKGLYHQTPLSKSNIEFKLYEKDGNPVSYAISVSSQKGTEPWVKVNHLVSFGEGECLREFLLLALKTINDWSLDDEPINYLEQEQSSV